jgi:hypothetical protein
MQSRIAVITLSLLVAACSRQAGNLAATEQVCAGKPQTYQPRDRAQQLKREIEEEQDTAISARYGKTVRAGSIVYKRPAPH